MKHRIYGWMFLGLPRMAREKMKNLTLFDKVIALAFVGFVVAMLYAYSFNPVVAK